MPVAAGGTLGSLLPWTSLPEKYGCPLRPGGSPVTLWGDRPRQPSLLPSRLETKRICAWQVEEQAYTDLAALAQGSAPPPGCCVSLARVLPARTSSATTRTLEGENSW